MRIHHLILPKYTGRPECLHSGAIMFIASNMCWCSDSIEIFCFDGHRVLAMDSKGITAEMRKDLLAESIEHRFGMVERVSHRITWLANNGSASITPKP